MYSVVPSVLVNIKYDIRMNTVDYTVLYQVHVVVVYKKGKEEHRNDVSKLEKLQIHCRLLQ
jgi:hypothetical protein